MMWSSVFGLVPQGQLASSVIFHLVRLSLVLHIRVRNRLRVHYCFRGRSEPCGNFSLTARCVLSCHLASCTDSGSSGQGTQCVSHVFLLIRGFGCLYFSRGFLSSVSLCNLDSASVLMISGGEIPERTYRSSRGVGLRQPVITRQASFRIGSILEALELFDQTGAQNSPVEKTRLRATVLMGVKMVNFHVVTPVSSPEMGETDDHISSQNKTFTVLQLNVEGLKLNEERNPLLKYKPLKPRINRKTWLTHCVPSPEDPESVRLARWQERTQRAAREKLPQGSDLPRKQWCTLNRLRTRVQNQR